MVSLIAKLKAVEDPGTENAKFHNLEDILFISIAIGVAGGDKSLKRKRKEASVAKQPLVARGGRHTK